MGTDTGDADATNPADELARVIPLHGRRDDDLLARLRESLADRGSVTQDLEPGDMVPKVWRATARRAAKDLGRPVRTLAVEHDGLDTITVHAILTDWPVTETEEAADMAIRRRIVDAVALTFPIPPVGGPTAG